MNEKARKSSERFLRKKYEHLNEREKKVAHYLAERIHISRDVAKDFAEQLTLGQRAADRVASFGGSWVFISVFVAIMIAWVLLNSFILVKIRKTFDPYPYILLNLFLSMLAAVQAPIILMSQNRQASIDRLSAAHDYEVNLKAELQIAALHEKLDAGQERWSELISVEQEQLSLLKQINEDLKKIQ